MRRGIVLAVGVGSQRAATGALQVVLLAAATRTMSPETVGNVAVVISVVFGSMLLGDFGTSAVAIRDLVRTPATRTAMTSLVWLKVTIACSLVLVIGFGAFLLEDRDLATLLAIGLIATPFAAAASASSNVAVASRRGVGLVAGASAGFGAGCLIGFWAAALHSALALVLALPTAKIVEFLVISIVESRNLPTGTTSPFSLRWLLACWPLGAQAFLAVLYQRSNVVMTAALLGIAASGRGAPSLSLYAVAALLPSVVATTLFPRIAEARASSAGAWPRDMRYVTLVAVGAVLPAAVLFTIAPEIPLRVLLGSTTPDRELVLRFCGPALLLAAPNSLILFEFVLREKRTPLVPLSIVTTAVGLMSLVIALQTAGVPGMGVAVLSAEAATSLIFGCALIRLSRPRNLKSMTVRMP